MTRNSSAPETPQQIIEQHSSMVCSTYNETRKTGYQLTAARLQICSRWQRDCCSGRILPHWGKELFSSTSLPSVSMSSCVSRILWEQHDTQGHPSPSLFCFELCDGLYHLRLVLRHVPYSVECGSTITRGRKTAAFPAHARAYLRIK